MRTKRGAAAVLAVVVLTFAGVASAYRQGRLIGRVVDAKGAPIAGARVTTTSPAIPDFNEVTATNDKGVFKVDFARIDVVYAFEFEKAGFLPLRVEQRWTVEGTDRRDFKMSPAEAPAIGDLPVAPVPESAAGAVAASGPGIVAFNAGVSAFKAQDYPTAAARFQEASELDPTLREAWVALSATHLELQHYPQAAEAAERAIALGATEESVLKTRWDAYRRQGDQAKAAKAREDLEKFGRLREEAKRIHNEGVTLEKIGEEKEAFAKFQEALQLDPSFEPALVGLATSGLKLGRAAEAAAAAETLLKLNPENAEALKIRYNAALKIKDEAKVVEALRGMAAIDPTTARDGLFLLASGSFDKDDTAKAKERLRYALQIDPAHARSHYLLGLILMREGAKQEARMHLQRFLELAPNDPDTATAKEALTHLK
jgi:tetratricopeptide (TPR) repeat protein